jgi:hypothetical protein
MRLAPEVSLMLVLTLGCGSAIFADAAPQPTSSKPAQDIDWDTAFADHSGLRPLHFVAQYQDARGTHRLEEWRTGLTHLRRRTDDRIDLHADATTIPRPGFPADYLWQIIDLQKKIDNRITSQAMLKAGMFYSYYAMAHVLTRPAGRFHLTRLDESQFKAGVPHDHSSRRQELSWAQAVPATASLPCTWYELTPEAQPSTRICWSPEIALPLQTQSHRPDGTWQTDYTLQAFDRGTIPPTTYTVNTAGLQIRNHDELTTED